jgi:hypothetical protein
MAVRTVPIYVLLCAHTRAVAPITATITLTTTAMEDPVVIDNIQSPTGVEAKLWSSGAIVSDIVIRLTDTSDAKERSDQYSGETHFVTNKNEILVNGDPSRAYPVKDYSAHMIFESFISILAKRELRCSFI